MRLYPRLASDRDFRPGAARLLRTALTAAPVLVATLAFALAPAPAAAQWQPDRFQFFCGTPFHESTLERWLNVLRAEGVLGSRHARHYLNYVDNPGRELDHAVAGCIDPGRLTESEDMARHALLQIKGVGSAVGRQFTDPSPARLGPVVVNDHGQQVVRFYVDPTYAGIGEASVQPRPGGRGIEDWSVVHVRFSPDHIATQPAWSRYRSIAHELVHVIQNAQPVRSAASADGPLAQWIAEGTADALAAEFMRSRGYGAQPPLSVRGSRPVYGLRPYNRALTWISDSGDRDRWGNAIITHYTASSFWTFLADRFFDGSFHYLIDWFAVPEQQQGGDDWLAWADALLRWDAGGIDHPLYLVFPEFIANYAAWGEKKYPHIGEEVWLEEAFGGCHTVTLSPATPVADLTLRLEQISAQCVKVLVGGVPAGQAVSVQVMAYDGDTDRLDNLHLTAARQGSTLGGRTFDCYEEAKRAGPNALCVHKPFLGAQGQALPASDMGGVSASGGGFVKTWLGTEQVAGDGLIENVYFVVHTPVDPRDPQHDYRFSQSTQEARLQIGFERHTIALNDGAAATLATARVNGSAGLGLVPMRGGDAPQGDFLAGITLPTGAASDPDVMSRTMFLQNVATGTLFSGLDGAPCAGVCAVLVEENEVRPAGFGNFDLAAVRMIGLNLEEPIPFGATGTFDAGVFACPQEDCEQVGLGEAVITVLEFSDQVLHLAASGSFCVIQGIQSLDCPDRQTFNVEIMKPFGWVYDGARTIHSIDTPGMEEYRESLSKGLADALPGMMTAWRRQVDPRPGEAARPVTDPTEEDRAGAGGAAVVQPCDCSCAGQAAVVSALEAYQAVVEAAENAGGQIPLPPPAFQTMLRCMGQCTPQWSQCPVPPDADLAIAGPCAMPPPPGPAVAAVAPD